MWKAWNNTSGEYNDFSTTLFQRDLVLSWKQLNVSVAKKNPKLFGCSEVVYEQILYNGKDSQWYTFDTVLEMGFLNV